MNAFSEVVKSTLGETRSVRYLVLKVSLKLLQLDSTTTKKEIENALQNEQEREIDSFC